MKKLIILILIAISNIGYSQTIKEDSSGNYVLADKKPNIKKSEAILTEKTFTDSKGVKYPVYISKTNKLFVIKTSQKTGKLYNYYLKV